MMRDDGNFGNNDIFDDDDDDDDDYTCFHEEETDDLHHKWFVGIVEAFLAASSSMATMTVS